MESRVKYLSLFGAFSIGNGEKLSPTHGGVSDRHLSISSG